MKNVTNIIVQCASDNASFCARYLLPGAREAYNAVVAAERAKNDSRAFEVMDGSDIVSIDPQFLFDMAEAKCGPSKGVDIYAKAQDFLESDHDWQFGERVQFKDDNVYIAITLAADTRPMTDCYVTYDF